MEARSADCPRLLLDVTVRYSVPGSAAERLARAADSDGSVNKEAEAEKHARYPTHQAPWRMLPLALESCGRHGNTALKHLRKLARRHAQHLEDSSQATASALLQRWGAQLSVALHKAKAKQLCSALGGEARATAGARRLAAELAG